MLINKKLHVMRKLIRNSLKKKLGYLSISDFKSNIV